MLNRTPIRPIPDAISPNTQATTPHVNANIDRRRYRNKRSPPATGASRPSNSTIRNIRRPPIRTYWINNTIVLLVTQERETHSEAEYIVRVHGPCPTYPVQRGEKARRRRRTIQKTKNDMHCDNACRLL